MVKNYCIDQLRRQKHIEEDYKDTFNMVPDSELSPHEKIERKETYNIIHRIITNLPEMYREIIRLRDIEEQSYEEIAAKTGQNINTLRVNISRARRIIRDEYKKHNDEFRGNKTIA
jgi:RNA polymerase sigma-70 factor (ECF subfamily)